ncbi:MAG TPA: hypothetical protein VM011_06650 [Gammaproteobacteria bacterium]|nr:hypothetical protein [Gammaproteobacteria bacterium]
MEKRLYFLIPDRAQALAVVDNLVGQGIGIDNIHAIGDQHTRMDGLPGTRGRGSPAGISSAQQLAWNANTICFAIAVVATFLAPVFVGLSGWLLLPVVIMAANFLTGFYLNSAANKELNEFRDAVAHGEILLVADVPELRVIEVEQEIQRHHPAATSSASPDWDAHAIGQ